MSTQIKPSRVLSFLCGILAVFGLWKPFSYGKIFQTIYEIIGGLFLFMFAVLYAFLMFANLFLMKDFTDVTNRLFMSLTEIALAVKVISVYFNNKSVQRMRNLLLTFPVESADEDRVLKTSHSTFQTMVFMYFFVSNAAIQVGNIVAGLSGENKLAYPGWYPFFDWEHNKRDYWTIFVYQYLGMFITCNLNLAIDSYHCFIMHMISIEVGVFGDRLSAIQNNENESMDKMKANLIGHYKTHQHIKLCIREVQKGLSGFQFTSISNNSNFWSTEQPKQTFFLRNYSLMSHK